MQGFLGKRGGVRLMDDHLWEGEMIDDLIGCIQGFLWAAFEDFSESVEPVNTYDFEDEIRKGIMVRSLVADCIFEYRDFNFEC